MRKIVTSIIASIGAIVLAAIFVTPAQAQEVEQVTISVSGERYVLDTASPRAGLAVPPGSRVFQLRSLANRNLCLDADTNSGGVNGNNVHLFTCLGTGQLNQFWWPRSWAGQSAVWTELVNVRYQTKCLDADNSGGLGNGVRVQLWDCFHDSAGHANQWWLFGPGNDQSYTILPNLGGPFVLDAAAQTIGNGGRVQLWSFNGGNQQFWRQ